MIRSFDIAAIEVLHFFITLIHILVISTTESARGIVSTPVTHDDI